MSLTCHAAHLVPCLLLLFSAVWSHVWEGKFKSLCINFKELYLDWRLWNRSVSFQNKSSVTPHRTIICRYFPVYRYRVIQFNSILFYPITLEGRRGTIDDFAPTPFHLVMSSAALIKLAKPIPVHSLTLCSHLFFCLPLLLFPFTVPCKIVFVKPEDLETWKNHLSYRFLTRVRSSS